MKFQAMKQNTLQLEVGCLWWFSFVWFGLWTIYELWNNILLSECLEMKKHGVSFELWSEEVVVVTVKVYLRIMIMTMTYACIDLAVANILKAQ
jgi:hypothetical protein